MALGSCVLCGGPLTGCTANMQPLKIGPSNGEVIGVAVGAGAAIAVGVIVAVEVHKSHHTLKGCVTSNTSGLELLNDGNKKVYALTGMTTGVKPGDVVRVHGNKQKYKKGSPGHQDFTVEKMVRDFGACSAQPAATHSGV